jgi:predicted ATPase
MHPAEHSRAISGSAPVASVGGSGPLSLYRTHRSSGQLRPDPAQELGAEKLQSLHNALARYRPASGQAGWRERLGLGRRREDPPQGLYIFGGVGRGKSMLMDMFFVGVQVERKRRAHFHEFMLDVHDRLHRQRGIGPGDRIRSIRSPPNRRPRHGFCASTNSR